MHFEGSLPHNSHAPFLPKAFIPPHDPLIGFFPKITPTDIRLITRIKVMNVKVKVVIYLF